MAQQPPPHTFRAALADAKRCPVEPEDLIRARDGAAVVGVEYLQDAPQAQAQSAQPPALTYLRASGQKHVQAVMFMHNR